MSSKSVLFVLVGNLPDYGDGPYSKVRPAGLFNSARMVVDMLNNDEVRASLVHAIDNNDIDRLVTEFKPDVVVIEALWVVPPKFTALKPLHPGVEWIVRLHSESPFLSLEGIALEWIREYHRLGVTVAVNSKRMVKDILYATGVKPVYLPNYYMPNKFCAIKRHSVPGELHVGCFGAIRPFKNHLIQAIAAMRYCDNRGLQLNFHVNCNRVEGEGSANILRNLRGLFRDSGHTLVEHGWYSHPDFLTMLDSMDLGLQCSLSETHNIVTADFVSLGIPVVVSHEISWASRLCRVNPTNVDDIVEGIGRVLCWSKLCSLPERRNIDRLAKLSKEAERDWLKLLA